LLARAGMMLGLLLLPSAVPSATPKGEPAEPVALLPVLDRAKVRAPDLLTEFRGGIAVALLRERGWRALPEREVEEILERLEARPPFKPEAIARVGDELGVARIVVPVLLRAGVKGKPPYGFAEAEVYLYEAPSWALRAKARASAKTTPKAGFKGERRAILAEALRLCGERVASELVKTVSLVGRVYASTEEEFLLGLGRADGLRSGAEVEVLRNGKVVARGKVYSPGLRDSYAKVTWLAEGERIERGLSVRVVYNPPPSPPVRPKKRIARERKWLRWLMWGLLAYIAYRVFVKRERAPAVRAAQIEASASTSTIPADGQSTALIRATVYDEMRNPVPDGTPVTFRTDKGTLSPCRSRGGWASSVTVRTLGGVAEALLKSPTEPGVATVRIEAPGAPPSYARVEFASPGAIEVTATPNTLPADGVSQAVILAMVKTAEGSAVRDLTRVEFSTTLGTITPASYTSGGVAQAILTAPTRPGTATVTARWGSSSASTTVEFTSGPPGKISLSVSPLETVADGRSKVTLTATVSDAMGNLVQDGTIVTFSSTLGQLLSTSATTQNGSASVQLLAPTIPGIAIITASSGEAKTTATVSFLPGPPRRVEITLDPPSLVADGTSTSRVVAKVSDEFGNPVQDGTTVTFSVDPQIATITPTATTTGGEAIATLRAGTTPGRVVITAKAGDASGQVTLVISGTTAARVELTTDKASLPADGQSTCALRAYAVDSEGNPLGDGTPVSFRIVSGPGSIRDADLALKNGEARATYVAGLDPGTVILEVEITGVVARTTVELLPLPASSISLAVEPNPVRIEGTGPAAGTASATVRAMVRDQRGRPVADGTIVEFSTTLGTVTSAVRTKNGEAVASFVSSDAGTALITAKSGEAQAQITLTVLPGPAASVTARVEPPSIPADGNSYAVVEALVLDIAGNPVQDGTVVEFGDGQGNLGRTEPDANGGGNGTVTPKAATTGGVARAFIVSKNPDVQDPQDPNFVSKPGTATVYIRVPQDQPDPLPDSPSPVQTVVVQVQFVSKQPAIINVTVEPANIRGLDVAGATAKVTAMVYDEYHNPVPDGTAVYFTATRGMIRGNGPTVGGVATSYTTGGIATATIYSDGEGLGDPSFNGWVQITVVSGKAIKTGWVIFSGPADETESYLHPTSVEIPSVNGKAVITVVAKDENGNPVVDGTIVHAATEVGTLDATEKGTVGGVATFTIMTSTDPANPTPTGTYHAYFSIERGRGMLPLQLPPVEIRVVD